MLGISLGAESVNTPTLVADFGIVPSESVLRRVGGFHSIFKNKLTFHTNGTYLCDFLLHEHTVMVESV